MFKIWSFLLVAFWHIIFLKLQKNLGIGRAWADNFSW